MKKRRKPKNIRVVTELKEELTKTELLLKGTIPLWLSGTLIRNGPIQTSVNDEQVSHWFDGLGMLHAFSFHKGKVFYTNKFLRSNAYQKVFKDGSLDYTGFAYDPCRKLFKRFLTIFSASHEHLMHNANVNVAKLADQYVALTETPLPVKFDKVTLDSLGVLNYEDSLPKKDCFESAHPHYDILSEETITYLVKYGRVSSYNVCSLKDGSSVRNVIAEIPVKTPSYMHSFSVTENYIIFTEYPFVTNPIDFLIKGKAFIHNFVWKPEKKTQFLVIDRQKGKIVKTFETGPFFSFHHVNAYEKNDEIIVDLVAYPDASIITKLADHAIRSQTINPEPEEFLSTQLMRYTLSLVSGAIKSQIIEKKSLEFPRINPLFDGKPYRYAYLVNFHVSHTPKGHSEIFKINMETEEVVSWFERGCYSGEPVFVPSPNATEEDDGVILAIIFDSNLSRSFLLILDAITLHEIGRSEVEHLIPDGLHGQYFS